MDLKWFHPNIDDSSKKSSLIIKSANGKAMKIVKVERKSSVLRVLHVDIQSELLDEDFRVEDFTISARNFSPEVLTWRRSVVPCLTGAVLQFVAIRASLVFLRVGISGLLTM